MSFFFFLFWRWEKYCSVVLKKLIIRLQKRNFVWIFFWLNEIIKKNYWNVPFWLWKAHLGVLNEKLLIILIQIQRNERFFFSNSCLDDNWMRCTLKHQNEYYQNEIWETRCAALRIRKNCFFFFSWFDFFMDSKVDFLIS